MPSDVSEQLRVYLVGGAVRDALLGRAVGDRDWVVVGSTPQQMLDLGFTPVGKDFPVYLHPHSHEEYALARTERKSARGHRGFTVHAAPDVTLEEDLERRDLTINAIAQDTHGKLIDPFGGASDLNRRLLRHVSAAFIEDPLRVFRVGRFAAQLPDFEVAPETLALMRDMAASGELAALSAERVWQELNKALDAPAPQRFFTVLASAAALADWFADIDIDALHFTAADALLRFAQLPLDADGFRGFCRRLKVPGLYRQTALDWVTWGDSVSSWQTAPAAQLNAALAALKCAHEPDRLQRMMDLAESEGAEVDALPSLVAAWRKVRPTQASPSSGPAYGEALQSARVALLERSR